MPYKTRAQVEAERDELRVALTDILDRVTDALGAEDYEDEDEDAVEEADDEEED